MIDKEAMRTSVVKKVEEHLLARHKSQALKDECDFLAGAMTVLAHINMIMYDSTEEMSMSVIPPLWILYPISGRSVVKELSK